MASSIITLNGYDLDTDLGLIPTTLPGFLGSEPRSLVTLDIPGQPGVTDAGVTPRIGAKILTINAMVKASSETTLYATLDRAKQAAGRGICEIKGPYSTTRAWYGTLQPFSAEAFMPTQLNGWANVTLAFLCQSPFMVDTAPSTLSFGSTAVDVPLGTAPSRGRDQWSAIIEIVGAATTPTLTWKNASGDTLGTMAFTYSPSAGDSISVDLGRKLVTRTVAGVRSNAFSYVTAGYFWSDLSADDGDYYTSAWPKVSVSSGSGSLFYFRHWK